MSKGAKPTEETKVSPLERWQGLRLERLVAFRRHLAAARAEAHADAEGFGPLVIAIEEVGASCLGRAGDLGKYKEPLRMCLRFDHHDGTRYDELYETVRAGRNSGMHSGAWVRHVATNGVELAILIEDALARSIMEKQNDPTKSKPEWRVEHFMVSEPVRAEPWQTVAHVRRLMLRNSFSFVPAWIEDIQAWRLIGDHALAEWLGSHDDGARKVKEQCSLQDAINSDATKPGPCLRLTVPADPLVPEATREAALAATKIGPALVVDGVHKSRLLGIITAFDLL